MKTASIKRCFLCLLGLAFLLTACGRREIPEKTMKAIIHDVFLVNAYQALYSFNTVRTDSIDIYTPILNGYGYELEDFRYTVDRWSLKKSSRFSALIEEAAEDISQENKEYIALQEARLKVDTLVGELYRDTLYAQTDSIWVRNRARLDRLAFTVPADEGTFRIRYRYLVDSADRNARTLFRYYERDSTGKSLRTGTQTLNRGEIAWIDQTFTSNPAIDSLEVILAEYPAGNRQAVAIRVDSVFVTYNPPIEAARKRYVSEIARAVFGITYPYEPSYPPSDSGALHVVPPLRPDTARHTDL
ncbi:MAG: hypothetical protein LBM20_06200 [Rikenellaceae bacterium]|nr:hypothetical protein [Rikenellaceae bacterium]